jgi:hypothetical protein
MEREAGYLVRYGSMGHVARFALDPTMDFAPHRGQEVVIHTHRGEEVGEVLVRVGASTDPGDPGAVSSRDGELAPSSRGAGSARPRLLRPATATDLGNAQRSTQLRAERFDLCERILGQEGWPLELIDVETLLDQNTTVIHYFGPRDLDLTLLRARFRSSSGFDVVFEPAGLDPGPEPDAAPADPGEAPIRRCGDCDCGGGGCGTARAETPARAPADASMPAEASSGACDDSPHSGCSSCGISRLRSRKRPTLD